MGEHNKYICKNWHTMLPMYVAVKARNVPSTTGHKGRLQSSTITSNSPSNTPPNQKITNVKVSVVQQSLPCLYCRNNLISASCRKIDRTGAFFLFLKFAYIGTEQGENRKTKLPSPPNNVASK